MNKNIGEVITSKTMTAEEYYNLSDVEKANFKEINFIDISDMHTSEITQKIFVGKLKSPEYKVYE